MCDGIQLCLHDSNDRPNNRRSNLHVDLRPGDDVSSKLATDRVQRRVQPQVGWLLVARTTLSNDFDVFLGSTVDIGTMNEDDQEEVDFFAQMHRDVGRVQHRDGWEHRKAQDEQG